MGTTRKYLGHLLQNSGITPACSEEERVAAEDLASIFTAHGFEPEVQEFNASPTPRVLRAVLGIGVFLGAVLMGIGGAVGVIGTLLAIAFGVVYVLERMGKITLPAAGGAGLSQNVIAYHQASGPLASPRNRPVVVVAHYDSPRADLFSNLPYATYRPIIVKLLPYAMLAPAIIALLRIFPFPAAAKAVLWVVAILVALVPLAYAVGVIANRFVLPYTSGSVCNKSSVAAMLGVMDAVAPCKQEVEFPQDVPFDEYFSEQIRRAEEEELAAAIAAGELPEEEEGVDGEGAEGEGVEAAGEAGDLEGTAAMDLDAAAAAAAAGVAAGAVGVAGAVSAADGAAAVDLGATAAMSMDEVLGATAVEGADDAVSGDQAEGGAADAAGDKVEAEAPSQDEAADTAADEPEDEEDAAEEPSLINAYGNYRFGEEVVRSIGMVPESCAIVYERHEPEPEEAVEEAPTAEADAAAAVEQEPEAIFDQESAVAADEYGEAEEAYDYDYDDDIDFRSAGSQAGIAGALSAVGAGAARLFSGMKRRGKDMIDSLQSQGGQEQGGADEVEEPEAQAAAADAETSVQAAVEHEAEEGALDAATSEGTDVENGDEAEAAGATQAYDASAIAEANAQAASDQAVDLGDTVAQGMPVQEPAPAEQPVETVDSLMAEILPTRPAVTPRAPQRSFNTVPDPSIPSINQVNATSRASLFDLPDPSSEPVDPFSAMAAPSAPEASEPVAPVSEPAPVTPQASASASGFSVIGPNDTFNEGYDAPAPGDGVFETISADAPVAVAPATSGRKRGLGKLFGRKKRQEESMSDWLGVDGDFDAKNSGRDIGSWDNFEGDDWKGGATGGEGVSVDELRDAVTSMGDDELLGHDIWFVATGASEFDNAGIEAFLDTHRDKLRGVFLINLEGIGAGEPCMLATEGERRVLKGDKRIMNLVRRVSGALHEEFGEVEMPYLATDAYRAMERSLRSLTIAGVEDGRLACSHTEDDLPYRVNVENVNKVADVVTEVIRRS